LERLVSEDECRKNDNSSEPVAFSGSDVPKPEALLNTLRLLYVEDDREALEELAHFLKKRVASLAVASNGLEALELCRRQTFDVILCDLWMPKMDGFTLIQTLREESVLTPVIITSAFSDLETVLKAIDLGIVKYCVKPIEADELLDSLCRIAQDKLSSSGDVAGRLMDRQQRLEAEKGVEKCLCSFAEVTHRQRPQRGSRLPGSP